jgi:predicted dehydrogenase
MDYRLRFFVLVTTLFFFPLVARPPLASAQEKAPVRVGVLGLDNYQAVAFAQLFNDPKAAGDLAGLKVTAAYPGTPSADIPESVEGLPKWKEQIVAFQVRLVDRVEDVLSDCDAVMIMPLDGRRHRDLVAAAVQAGKRIFVGRPLAASFDEVLAIQRLAADAKVPLWSSSQHRFSPGFSGMRNHPEVGKVVGCDVYGGCPTVPHHSDYYWHALHGIETLYAIMGPGVESVRCVSTDKADVITATWNDGRVGTFRGIKQGAVKYSATVFGEQGVSIAGVYGHGVPVKGVAPTNDKYMGYEGIAIEMAKFFKGGPVPVSPEETVEIFAFMEAARASKMNQGQAQNPAAWTAKAKP